MGGRRPAGAGSVEAPESNTCLPAPDISLVAAVRDWVRRANGPITTNGLRLGRQLETAKEQFATQLTCRGIDENKCIQLLRNHQTLRRRSARVLRDIRLQRDEARARRHLRLRARIQSLPQIPILAPVNASEEQVSQNITNSTAGRIDGLRALQRRAARERRRKVAVLCPEGTRYSCSLGSITRFAPREATVTRRPLRIAASLLFWGLPLEKKRTKKLRRNWERMDLGLLGELLVGPCHSAHLTLGHQFVTLFGPPESASLPLLALRDATKLNPTSSGKDTSWRLAPLSCSLKSAISLHSLGRLKGPGAATMSRPPTVHNAYGRCAYRPSHIIGHCFKCAVAAYCPGTLRHRKV